MESLPTGRILLPWHWVIPSLDLDSLFQDHILIHCFSWLLNPLYGFFFPCSLFSIDTSEVSVGVPAFFKNYVGLKEHFQLILTKTFQGAF